MRKLFLGFLRCRRLEQASFEAGLNVDTRRREKQIKRTIPSRELRTCHPTLHDRRQTYGLRPDMVRTWFRLDTSLFRRGLRCARSKIVPYLIDFWDGAFDLNSGYRLKLEKRIINDMHFDKFKNLEQNQDELSLKDFKLCPSEDKRPVAGRWVGPNETVEIQGIKIVGGYFYFVDGRIDADDHCIDASTIESGLSISQPPQVHQNHYPWIYELSYRFFSQRDRWTYLNWLAGDRDLDSIESDFIWIYVFGIERRLLIDTKSESLETSEILKLREELVRVYETFERPGFHDLPGLISYTWLLFPHASAEPAVTSERFSRSMFRFKLGRAVKMGEPIGDDIAWDWFQHVVGFHERRVRNIERLFEDLFRRRYKEQYGDGLIVESDESKLHIHFEPLNPALDFYRGATFELPDVSQSKPLLSKLRRLAHACFTELEPYQRFLKSGRKNTKASLKAFTLLPLDLVAVDRHRRASGIRDWITNQSDSSDLFIDVSLSQLLEQFGTEKIKTIGKRTFTFISKVLERTGFSIAPNPNLHISKPKLSGRIVLFRSTPFEPSKAFTFYVLLIRLGFSISASLDLKMAILSEKIADSELSSLERQSLLAFLFWHKTEETNFSGLKPAIVALNLKQKTKLCDLLIHVALVEKGVDKVNMKALEKIYRLLGVDKTDIIGDIHRAMAPGNIREEETTLDLNLVKERESETEIVKTILGQIFADEDAPSSTLELPGLDKMHQALFEVLITKKEWSTSELSGISKRFNLMLSGALEVINDYAFEKTDNPIVEFDGTYVVDQETVEELKQLISRLGET